MRKLYRSLSALLFLVLCSSVIAQQSANFKLANHKTIPLAKVKFNPKSHSVKKANGVTETTFLDYMSNDQQASSNYSGIYAEQLNMHFTIKDTGKGSNQNFDLNHSATVAFDTIIDANSDSSFMPIAGTVKVDTLAAIIAYRNTSGKNDTVKFVINNVTAAGYPGTTVLNTTTLVMKKGTQGISGTTTDSLYYLYVVPNFTITSGYQFAVTVQFYGAKTDTFDIAFSFPQDTCKLDTTTYCNKATAMGPKIGKLKGCSSYLTGWEVYQAKPYTAVMWPNTAGEIYGNGFATNEWANCGADTEYFPYQDLAIFSTVSYTNNLTTGMSNLTNGGFSVNQNQPNPFNQSTAINYSLAKASDVEFSVYDMTGRKVMANTYTEVSPGQHTIKLGANEFSPGIYFYSFNVNGNVVTKKMVITQ